MLLVNVHKLDVVLAQPVAFCALEDQVDNIRCVLSLESEDVLVLRATENFCEGGKVDAEGEVTVAAEG